MNAPQEHRQNPAIGPGPDELASDILEWQRNERTGAQPAGRSTSTPRAREQPGNGAGVNGGLNIG